jgi:hypothetical protein
MYYICLLIINAFDIEYNNNDIILMLHVPCTILFDIDC